MIYTFGCSMTKWYWPTWADWLQVYDQPVINLANKGYGNQNIYWILVDKINTFTPDDHINIMWAENHRIGLWYDEEWVDNKHVKGFFPDTNGKLWFSTGREPCMGLYRTHPDLYSSFTNMIVDQLQIIYQTQLLLDKIGCSYTMHSAKNIWADGRPKFYPRYQTTYQEKDDITADEITTIKKITEMSPIRNLINLIDWKKFINPPKNPFNPKDFSGIWEYFINNKEYVILKHETDHHPNTLAHHDYALEMLLNKNPKTGKYRAVAEKISKETIELPIPEFTPNDFVISPTVDLLMPNFKELLGSLK